MKWWSKAGRRKGEGENCIGSPHALIKITILINVIMTISSLWLKGTESRPIAVLLMLSPK
jgi:hypothetical protein